MFPDRFIDGDVLVADFGDQAIGCLLSFSRRTLSQRIHHPIQGPAEIRAGGTGLQQRRVGALQRLITSLIVHRQRKAARDPGAHLEGRRGHAGTEGLHTAREVGVREAWQHTLKQRVAARGDGLVIMTNGLEGRAAWSAVVEVVDAFARFRGYRGFR